MSAAYPVTIDFETEAIEARPNYPPKPVGVSIKYPGLKAQYFAFGHPTDNNCTELEARAALRQAWAHPGGLLFHNAKFDIDVAETHMGMPRLPWQRYHDTMLQVVLDNPHAVTHSLKPISAALLGMPATEANELKSWLVDKGYCTKTSKNWGAHISKTPGSLCGKYADGDVIRTDRLHRKLLGSLKKRKMLPAYDRERELMLYLLDNERAGIPVDLPKLAADVDIYSQTAVKLDRWIRLQLKHSLINLDSGDELVQALERVGKIDLGKLGLTETLLYRTDKESLAEAITDPRMSAALAYRASLATCLGTFLRPWLAQATQTGGRIHTSWSQMKNYEKGRPSGTVTGRLSSSPNFQNVPKEFKPLWSHEKKGLPKAPFALPPLPLCRSYITAEKGHVIVDRDYSQQELRILAQYAGGELLDAYRANPNLDLHQTVASKLSAQLGREIKRGPVKTVNFGLIYGMGVGLMATKAGVDVADAKEIKEGVLAMFPGIADINRELRTIAGTGETFRTWGGRQYRCEPPSIVKGELRTFEYKMINVLVQGSAADCTKEAMLRYMRAKPKGHHLMLTVHDEILLSVPAQDAEFGHTQLKRAMESVEFDVPMLSDGKTSATNWAELK